MKKATASTIIQDLDKTWMWDLQSYQHLSTAWMRPPSVISKTMMMMLQQKRHLRVQVKKISTIILIWCLVIHSELLEAHVLIWKEGDLQKIVGWAVTQRWQHHSVFTYDCTATGLAVPRRHQPEMVFSPSHLSCQGFTLTNMPVGIALPCLTEHLQSSVTRLKDKCRSLLCSLAFSGEDIYSGKSVINYIPLKEEDYTGW